MSLPMHTTKKCAVCGMESEQIVLTSTNTFGGGPDLDLRPAEMMRSTMCWWIQECPHCGYISGSLDDETSVTNEWLKEDEYTQCSGLSFLSKLAEKFYKYYLINKADENPEDAFYAILHAAWACDDERDAENALLCRRLAIKEIDAVIRNQPYNFELKIQKVDLLRRAEMFHATIGECCNLSTDEELLTKIITFEMDRAIDGDSKCYTVENVVK